MHTNDDEDNEGVPHADRNQGAQTEGDELAPPGEGPAPMLANPYNLRNHGTIANRFQTAIDNPFSQQSYYPTVQLVQKTHPWPHTDADDRQSGYQETQKERRSCPDG